VTASFRTLAWFPFRFTGPGFKCKKLRSAHFPALSCGALNGPNQPRWSSENFVLILSKLRYVVFWATACFTITGLPPFTSGTAFQTVTV